MDGSVPPAGPPRFVSLEGVDGAGKSTQARLLADHLRACGRDVVELREPGGTPAGERLRALLLDPQTPLAPRGEALLFAAARAQAVVDVVEPALARGATVIADRFVDSSLVYQGHVRGLGIEAVRELNRFALGGRMPDRTVVLTLATAEAARRRDGDPPDRFEEEPDAFQQAVAEGYRLLAQDEPGRIVEVDAAGDPAEVARRVREALGVG